MTRLEKDGSGTLQLYLEIFRKKKVYQMPYGVIFTCMPFPPGRSCTCIFYFNSGFHNNLETYCALLKKHRITSNKITIREVAGLVSEAQYMELVKILKPKYIQCWIDTVLLPYEGIFKFYQFVRFILLL